LNLTFKDNPKQAEFVEQAIMSAWGESPYRYLCYGGGIRGGKTFAVLGTLLLYCRMFPGSRWVIYRQDFPSLQDTTIPSLEKIIGNDSNFKWSRDKSNYHIEYLKNGSKIFLYGENIDRDPDLNAMLGLECNGIVLEQVEELSETLFNMAQTRIGSWYIPVMPKPMILMTLNPTQKWAKNVFYEPYKLGTIEPPFKFIEALPKDNPFVTAEQWEAWNRLEGRYKAQFIEGDWTDFTNRDNIWAFAFNRKKHLSDVQIDTSQMVYLSFDFNRNPITCAVIQHIDGQIRVIEQIKLSNSDIYKICTYIKAMYGNSMFIVTGDATGKNSSAMVQDNINYYTIIQKELRLNAQQIKVPTVNPRIEENQVLVNSIFANYNITINSEKCKPLIFDLENARMRADGTLIKENRDDITQQLDCLDCLRYYLNQFHGNFIKLRSI
jgi:hypothetical protein